MVTLKTALLLRLHGSQDAQADEPDIFILALCLHT